MSSVRVHNFSVSLDGFAADVHPHRCRSVRRSGSLGSDLSTGEFKVAVLASVAAAGGQ